MSGAGGAVLMSCVREGSLEPPYRPPHAIHHNGEGRTNRFFRGLRRMFKRRGSGTSSGNVNVNGSRADSSPDPKSSSTSELLDVDRYARRKEGAYGSGLSVSHDSVFTGERSGDDSGDERPGFVSSHRAELVAAVRRRGRGDSDDDEDLGLPRSPPASPPTDKADKRHHTGISQSSCSDGSLLSVGSSEMEEDSSSTQHDHSDIYNSSEPPSGVAPLSHSAAKHKMAVRPRRTHGAPRRNKASPLAATALPITPELNEEITRSTTPDGHTTTHAVTESITTTTAKQVMKEHHHHHLQVQRVLEVPEETKSKSSSLPPGLALSHLVGHGHNHPSPKLTIAEQTTPRSSIKRSKSSSQDQTLRDSPKIKTKDNIQSYHSEERVSRHRVDGRYAEETCLEKKSKSEKKIENEVIRSKKEESFFSRLLLRKSGKKSKKEQLDERSDSQEVKKTKTDKTDKTQHKIYERSGLSYEHGVKPTPAERTHRTTGQKVFANQMHKRLDNKGAYVQDGAYKDVYSAAKVSGMEYNITDLKIAEETDKILNMEIKSRFSRRDEFNEKVERSKRTSKEAVDDKRESLIHDKGKRPTSVQRMGEFSSKAFISNEQNMRVQEELSPQLISEDEPPIRAMRIKNQNEYTFHSGSMPKNLPYFNPSIVISDLAPVKTPRNQHTEIKHRSAEHVSEFCEKKLDIREQRTSKTEESYVSSGLRSLGDEYVESRSSIGKSHSFRYASETASLSSQDSQMPSLPAIVGISEPLLESWEVNYRRNVSDRHDYSKRLSARNYGIINSTAEQYDSLPSTDSSYLDSLKTDVKEDMKLFTNSIHINIDSRKRDSDISQIEAKIDDIISSPKPIIASILKSSSLDSVKSSPEKPADDRRKTISVDCALSHSAKIQKHKETESFISVTHINKEQTPTKDVETTKLNKSEEKLPKVDLKYGVPEFLNIQLNRVDAKPATNVVLNVTPKKPDSPQADKEQEIECFKVNETKTQTIKRESVVSKIVETISETNVEDKNSPLINRRSVIPISPVSPSTPKAFFKRKSTSVEAHEKFDRSDKPRTNSMSTEGSTEKIFDNISMDRKSHSSFGSKSSIQSTDSNERIADDSVVVYRKKAALSKELNKKDDEPELLKVFARRSLKIKDSDAVRITQEIEATKEENITANKTKILKNEFNASIKSRDSDKENDNTQERQEEKQQKENQEEKRLVDIAARVSQFGAAYQRSCSINSVSNPKRESAPIYKSDVNKYKKEVSDSTPEKRLRNRTFPDPSNDREIQNITNNKNEIKADTLKRSWCKDETNFKNIEQKASDVTKNFKNLEQKSNDVAKNLKKLEQKEKPNDSLKQEDVVIERDGEKETEGSGKEKEDEYKGILQRRAEWERRAKQGTTK